MELPIKSAAAILAVSDRFPRTSRRRAVECAIKEKNVTDYAPYNSQFEGGIKEKYAEFHIAPSNDLIDLSNLVLDIKAQVVDSNGQALGDAIKFNLTNNTLHSIIRSVTVFFNGVQVEHQNLYSYNALLKTLTGFKPEDLETYGELIGLNSPKQWNPVSFTDGNYGNMPIRLSNKLKEVKSHGLHLRGPLALDIGSTDQYLVNGVAIRIRLELAEDAHIIGLAAGNDDDARLRISSIKLLATHLATRTNSSLALEQSLTAGNLVYPFKKYLPKTLVLGAGQSTLSVDNLYLGIVPKSISFFIMGMTTLTENKFDTNKQFFPHNNLRNVHISVDNRVRYNINTSFPHDANELYYHVLKSIGPDSYHLLDKQSWINGSTIVHLDLTNELLEDGMQLNETGNVRFSIELDKPAEKNLILYLIAETDATFSINAQRQVTVTSLG